MAFAGGFMKPPSRPPRTPSRLSDFLHHQLNSYVLAASAAGVSLLALTPPAEAKVVYTKTHQDIGTNGIYELDLNHDGIVDFLLQQFGTSSLNSNRLLADEALGNAVLGSLNRSNDKSQSHSLSLTARGFECNGLLRQLSSISHLGDPLG